MADSMSYNQNGQNFESIDTYGMVQQYANEPQSNYLKNNYGMNQYGGGYDNMQYGQQQQNRPWKSNPGGMYQGTKRISKNMNGFDQGQGTNYRSNFHNQGRGRGRFNGNNHAGGYQGGDRPGFRKRFPNNQTVMRKNSSQEYNAPSYNTTEVITPQPQPQPQSELVPPEYQNVDLVALASSLDLNDPTQLAYYHEIANLVQQAQMQAANPQPTTSQSNQKQYTKNATTKTIQNASSYYKTKICPGMLMKGVCSKGMFCTFAHSDTELKRVPDLAKTKLCPIFLSQGSCPNELTCKYAHGHHELRSTPEFFKTSLCTNYAKFKRCALADKCRYAHGEHELRAIRSVPIVVEPNSVNISQNALELQNQLDDDSVIYQGQNENGNTMNTNMQIQKNLPNMIGVNPSINMSLKQI